MPMRLTGLFAIAAVASFLAADAAAAGEAAAGGSCDFFQAQLIGLLCGGTGYVAPGLGGSDLRQDWTRTTPGLGRFFPAQTRTDHWDYRQSFEGVTAAVSPWQGVRFHVEGEALQYDERDRYDIVGGGGGGGGGHFGGGFPAGFGSRSGETKWTGAYGGWQSAGFEATIWDQKTESGRYLLNVIGGFGYFAGGGVYGSRDRQRLGWESGAQWRLGGSGFSVVYGSQTLLERLDNPGEIRALSQSRLLLASDAWGVALGPLLTGQTELWHAAGYNTGWTEARLGADLLAAPFRATTIPLLRDMTLEASAAHSIGQAGLIPAWAGKASGYDYAASARFNFRY